MLRYNHGTVPPPPEIVEKYEKQHDPPLFYGRGHYVHPLYGPDGESLSDDYSMSPEVDGVSLVPVLRGEERTIRPWLHFEHAPCYSQSQAFHALTDGRYKYIWRPADGREQLFDLNADAQENHNLAEDPAHKNALEQWRGRLAQRLAPRPEGFSDGQQLIPGRPYRPLQAGVPHTESQ